MKTELNEDETEDDFKVTIAFDDTRQEDDTDGLEDLERTLDETSLLQSDESDNEEKSKSDYKVTKVENVDEL